MPAPSTLFAGWLSNPQTEIRNSQLPPPRRHGLASSFTQILIPSPETHVIGFVFSN
jgi:hypothetical protein